MPSVRTRLLAATALAVAAAPALAAPAVVADVAPVQSIVAAVMDGIGAPGLLTPPGASPHAYALKPSEAQALADADVVVWIGPSLSPWLVEPLDALAPDAVRVELDTAEGVRHLPIRLGGPFEPHVHEGDGHDHAAEAEDHAAEAGAHDGHDHAAEVAAHDDHDHDHDHDHAAEGGVDPHLWLDPANAAAIATVVAARLSEVDPEHAAAYAANAEAFGAEMTALSAEIAATVAPLRGKPYFVFHDAYQYFETAFDLPAAGSISLSDAEAPRARRVAEIRDRLLDERVVCVFTEPQFEPKIVTTLTEGTEVRTGSLDHFGVGLDLGPDQYEATLRGMARDLAACLGAQS
jgi:zinc transport system substrate-binding protein